MLKDALRQTWRGISAALSPQPQPGTHAELARLALLHNSDKRTVASHIPNYARHFGHLRERKLKILEIGVGGYKSHDSGGNSLRMWKDYFPNSTIHGLDLYDKSALAEARIEIHKGDQCDPACLRKIHAEMGGIDIVIDDGSHYSEHVIFTFQTLFPLLAEDGIYAVEDTQSSYWKFAGGDSENLNNPATLMNYFKALADGLNYQEVPRLNYEPTLFDRSVVGVHFYHNLLFVEKGRNADSSNKADFVARLAAESASNLQKA